MPPTPRLLPGVLALFLAACYPKPGSDDPTAGTRAVALGDVDGDGVEDLALTARFDPISDDDSYSSWILSGASGAVLLRIEVAKDAGREAVARKWSWPLGAHEVHPVGDIDQDGRADLAVVVGGYADPPTRSGALRVVSGASGKLLGRFESSADEDGFGSALARLETGTSGKPALAVTTRGQFWKGVPGCAVLSRRRAGPHTRAPWAPPCHSHPQALRSRTRSIPTASDARSRSWATLMAME